MLVKLITGNDIEIYETVVPDMERRPDIMLWRNRCFQFVGESFVDNKAKYYSYREVECYVML